MTQAPHEASGQALGYLYQIGMALYELLRRSRANPAIQARIEHLDDVVFETDGTPTELLQTKHHIRHTTSLSDTSRDLWRTIGAWADAIAVGSLRLDTTVFTMLTTAIAPDTSAVAKLRPGPTFRPAEAQALLEHVARTGDQETNAKDYARLLAMSSETRRMFFSSIVLHDNTPDAESLRDLMATELRRAVLPIHLDPFIERLFGYWHLRVITHLKSGRQQAIAAVEIEEFIQQLRDSFALDNLPLDYEDPTDVVDALAEDDRTYVRQLQLIAANNRLIELAISDYKRAFAQQMRWANDHLLLTGELAKYEFALVSEWRHHQALVAQRHATAATEDEWRAQGFALFEACSVLDERLRPRLQSGFILRGTLHALADDLRVGWHPDFLTRLRSVVEAA